MSNVYLDIETIPCQTNYDEYLEDALKNFKPPTSLTKTQACADLGITGDKAKYTSKDDAIRMWVEEFGKEKAPEVADENWRKTSFDGGYGEIISIAWAVNNEPVLCKYRQLNESEKDMIVYFLTLAAKIDTCYFIGHHITFDLKFLFHRCVVLGINPADYGVKFPFYGRHNQDYFDTMTAWCGYKDRISQDNLCKILGIEGKPDDIDGSNVWDHVNAGNIRRVAEYNIDDVEKVRKIYKKLKFIGV
jgi:predicted PolB exonuclease-like 3'-5' exonuclease